MKRLYDSLENKLVFLPLNRSKSVKLSNKLQKLRAKFIDNDSIPNSSLKKYVRLVIELDIGQYLKDKGKPSQTFSLKHYPNLHKAWHQPHEYFQ